MLLNSKVLFHISIIWFTLTSYWPTHKYISQQGAKNHDRDTLERAPTSTLPLFLKGIQIHYVLFLCVCTNTEVIAVIACWDWSWCECLFIHDGEAGWSRRWHLVFERTDEHNHMADCRHTLQNIIIIPNKSALVFNLKALMSTDRSIQICWPFGAGMITWFKMSDDLASGSGVLFLCLFFKTYLVKIS